MDVPLSTLSTANNMFFAAGALVTAESQRGRGGSPKRHHGKYFAACTLGERRSLIGRAQAFGAEPQETHRNEGGNPSSCYVAVAARMTALAGIGIRRRPAM